MKKIIVLFILFFEVIGITNASPFDIIYNNYPDFVVSDILQNSTSKDIFIKICNIGGDMNEDGTLSVGITINSSKIISNSIANVNLNANSCGDYRVASISDLPVALNGYYLVSGAVLMKSSKNEKTKSNNYLKKNIYLSILNVGYNMNNLNINNTYYYNMRNSIKLPDLVVDNVLQDNYGALNVRICNKGYSMNAYENFFTTLYNGNFNLAKSTNLMLNKGDCINIPFNTGEISINTKGSYILKARTDVYRNVAESNENNNSFSKSLRVRCY